MFSEYVLIFRFRVVSYNTLSTRYSETNLQFPYCSNEFLSIDYRKHLLLKEIRGNVYNLYTGVPIRVVTGYGILETTIRGIMAKHFLLLKLKR